MTDYSNPKVDALIEAASGLTEAEFLALAMAALDQAGVRSWTQLRVIDLLDVDVDERAIDDADQRYDDEINRRYDEARGK